MGSAADARLVRSCGSSRSRPSTATRCSRSRGRPRSGSTGRSTPARARRPSTHGSSAACTTRPAGGDAHFATILQATGAPVGSTSFCTVARARPRARDRLDLADAGGLGHRRQHRGEVPAAAVRVRALGCIRVDFDTYEENARSRAALAKLPAQFEGVWRNYSIRESDGEQGSSAFYSVIDDEWPAVRANLIARLKARGAGR